VNPLDYLLFWGVCVGLFLLPGALIARRLPGLWHHLAPGERLLPAFLLSAGVGGVVTSLAMLLRPRLSFTILVWAIVTLLLLLWNLWPVFRRSARAAKAGERVVEGRAREAEEALREADRTQRGAEGAERIATGRGIWLSVAACLVFGWAAMMIDGGSLGFIHDSLDFAAFVNRMLQTNSIDLVSGAYPATIDLSPDPRRGVFHVVAAVLCRLSGVSATEMWRVFPTFLVPLALGIFFMTTRQLLRSSTVALFSLLFLIAGTFFTGHHFINNLAYASRLGWVYSWIGLWSVARYRDVGPRPGRAAYALAILCAPILVGIHVLAGLQYLIALGALAWAWALVKQDAGEVRANRRGLAWLPLLATGALLPFLLITVARSYSTANPLFDHAQGLMFLSGRWAVMEPQAFVRWLGPPGLLAVLLALPLIPGFRRDDARAYLVGSTFVPLLILFNPVIIRPLEAMHGHSLLYRVMLIVPHFQLLGWYVVWSGRQLKLRAGGARTLAAALLLLAIAGMVGQQILTGAQLRARTGTSRVGWQEMPALQAAFAFLDREAREPVPAFSRHYAMTAFGQHASPADAHALERIQDAQAALNPYVSLARTHALLRKYAVRYVLLNHRFMSTEVQFCTVIDPRTFSDQRAKFAGHPESFEDVYAADGVWVFRVREPSGTGPAESDHISNPFLLTDTAAATATGEGGVRDGTARGLARSRAECGGISRDGINLIAATFDSTTALQRGGTLEIASYWRRSMPAVGLPTLAFVRLETELPGRLGRSPLLGRLYRKYVEMRRGTTYRFGAEREPLGGAFPAFLWEPNAIYCDTLAVRVPRHAQPGRYTVRLQLLEATAAPNLYLRDLFTLRDSRDGPIIGTIEIR
jgi:hypothetical protein